jgi:hypothetical protein
VFTPPSKTFVFTGRRIGQIKWRHEMLREVGLSGILVLLVILFVAVIIFFVGGKSLRKYDGDSPYSNR